MNSWHSYSKLTLQAEVGVNNVDIFWTRHFLASVSPKEAASLATDSIQTNKKDRINYLLIQTSQRLDFFKPRRRRRKLSESFDSSTVVCNRQKCAKLLDKLNNLILRFERKRSITFKLGIAT